MYTDNYGQIILSENDLCDLLLKKPDTKFRYAITSEQIEIPKNFNLTHIPKLIQQADLDITVDEFDKQNQNNWLMPDDYKNFDIAKYVLEKCKDDAELQRAGEELLLFHERDMFDLLRYLKYLVDIMRENNIVWGVGRGSSVASFVLYLLEVHKINSLYYDLNIDEFLK